MNWTICGASKSSEWNEVIPQVAESRGFDAGHEVLQVFAGPFEPETRESEKDRAYRWGRKAIFRVGARSRRFEIKPEFFEAVRCG